MRIFRRLKSKRGERGQALVEFSLVAIVFFLIVFGMLDTARLFESWNSVQHASRQGARFAITGRIECDDHPSVDPTDNFREECIETVAKRSTTGLTGGGIDAEDGIIQVSTRAWNFTGSDWPDPAIDGARGKQCDQIEVKVRYRHHFITPLLTAVVPGGIMVEGTQRMTNEPFGSCNDYTDGVVGP